MGTFYPPSLKPNHRLEYYAQKFSTVELNSSLSLPALPSVYGMLNKVPEGFDFFVKAHRDLTHVRRNAKETLPRFREMLKAYHREQKLAGVLFQFPANLECGRQQESTGPWNYKRYGRMRLSFSLFTDHLSTSATDVIFGGMPALVLFKR